MTHHVDIDMITLTRSSHARRLDGTCLLEAVAWYAGEAHSDRPACVSPVLAAYGRALNDRIPLDRLQELKQFIIPQLGTAGDGLDVKRSYLAADAAVRVFAPLALDAAGLEGEAVTLRALPPVTARDSAAADAAAAVAYAAYAARAAGTADPARAAAYAAGAAAYAARAADAAAWDEAIGLYQQMIGCDL